jgi:hypothetical protein
MAPQLSIHLRNFNKRVQVMSQTNAKEMILTKLEAQNMQAEMFELLAHITELSAIKKEEISPNKVDDVGMDGGTF